MAGATGRVQTRRDLSAAALALFADRGYEATTVDQIAVAAGVARRTFFRYFPTKEDAVFPDHDSTVTRVQSVLDSASPADDPIDVVCEGVREVLRMYAADPTVAVARYRLLREVPALREREIAVVSRYQRLFTKFLLSNWAAESALPDAALYAEVSAAAVVAAHNHVLRQWLRADARGDAFDQLDRALDSVRHRFTEIVVRRRKRVLVTVTEVGTDNEEIISAVRDALRLPVIRRVTPWWIVDVSTVSDALPHSTGRGPSGPEVGASRESGLSECIGGSRTRPHTIRERGPVHPGTRTSDDGETGSRLQGRWLDGASVA